MSIKLRALRLKLFSHVALVRWAGTKVVSNRFRDEEKIGMTLDAQLNFAKQIVVIK